MFVFIYYQIISTNINDMFSVKGNVWGEIGLDWVWYSLIVLLRLIKLYIASIDYCSLFCTEDEKSNINKNTFDVIIALCVPFCVPFCVPICFPFCVQVCSLFLLSFWFSSCVLFCVSFCVPWWVPICIPVCVSISFPLSSHLRFLLLIYR